MSMILVNEKDVALKTLRSARKYLAVFPVELYIKEQRYIFTDFPGIDELIRKINNDEEI